MESLRGYLEVKLGEHEKRDPQDNNRLWGDLLSWGAAVVGKGTLYEAIESQVIYQAGIKKMNPREVIDYLFSQPNHDQWMRAFQID